MLAGLLTLLGCFFFVHFVICTPGATSLDTASPNSPNSPVTDGKRVRAAPPIGYCGGLNDTTILTTGDDLAGPGFWITDGDVGAETKFFFLYENSRDEHPWKYLSLAAGGTAFVSVCETWEGRVVRGLPSVNMDGKVHNLGTWFQSSIAADGWMWGAISFLEGCDGGGSVSATDGSSDIRECDMDLLTQAPADALATKDTGTQALDKLVGDTANGAARDWELAKCSPDQVWIDVNNTGPVIKSTNGRLAFTFFLGNA
ncbi:hypothetical protein GGR50DRAFT_697887 [Xylaria sp. CBS 124048]|nr:hypothetical protein GGR50DRAFT_697887 [Xylaria sp. CBS 124048]